MPRPRMRFVANPDRPYHFNSIKTKATLSNPAPSSKQHSNPARPQRCSSSSRRCRCSASRAAAAAARESDIWCSGRCAARRRGDPIAMNEQHLDCLRSGFATSASISNLVTSAQSASVHGRAMYIVLCTQAILLRPSWKQLNSSNACARICKCACICALPIGILRPS